MEPLVPLRVPVKWICLSIILVLLYAIPSSSTETSLDVPRNVSVDGIIFEGEILGKPPIKCRHGKYCKLKHCRNSPVCKDKKKPEKPKKEKERDEYCETDISKLIKANMDEQIDPCDDFYSFACKGFSEMYPPRNESNYKNVDFMIKNDVMHKIKRILQRKYSKTSQSRALAEARRNFEICTRKERMDASTCVKRAMKKKAAWPLARGYVVNFGMTNREKTDLERMFRNIRQSFLDDLSAISWLDDRTEGYARDKAKAVKLELSHKEELFQYDEIPPDKLDKDGYILQDAATELPTELNAHYYFGWNSIIVLRAMMNYPFLNLGLPVLDYAAMGSVLAHEFTHGFDDKGRKYNANGNIKDWWSAKAAEQFKKHVACFEEQYGEFYITTKKGEKLYLDAKKTSNEDISDNGGVSLSYRAYKRLDPKKEKLRDLEDYTDEQLFFIGYANSFCQSETIEHKEETIKTDVYSLNKYRVNVPLSNMKEFATAFKCREGKKMNPVKKCKIW